MLQIQTKIVKRGIYRGILIGTLVVIQSCGWLSSKNEDDTTVVPEDTANTVQPSEPLPADKLIPAPAEVLPSTAVDSADTPQSDVDAKLKSTVQVIPATPAATPDVTLQPMPTKPVVASPVPAPEKDPAKPKPVSKGPDHFVITVAAKDATHPLYGKGHFLGFVVDGVQGKELVLQRGKTYTFEVATDPKHDVYFSSKDIGWGSSAWVDGVAGQYIYEGTMTLAPNNNAPETLYYSCRNHPYMGGRIDIVNPGEKVQRIVEKKQALEPAEGPVIPNQSDTTVTATMVNQKLMFADMLIKSKNSQRVLDSGIKEAIAMQVQATGLVTMAHKQLKENSIPPAYESATQGLELLKQAARLVPSEEQLAEQRNQYNELLASIKEFEQSHSGNSQRISKKQGQSEVVDYDKPHVEALKQEAGKLAQAHDYAKANKLLTKAQGDIMLALKNMLDSKTIVYDLKFESAEEEYEYELKRFGGYEELIPVAIEAKNPSAGSIQLMETYLKKGKEMREAAKKKAAGGDFPTAIAMLLDATKEVRRALRMVGVTQ